MVNVSVVDFRNRAYGIKGKNPFAEINFKDSNRTLADVYPVYDWVNDNGRDNMGSWIEAAARKAGR